MNKKELITAIAAETGMTKEAVKTAIEKYQETIVAAVAKGEKVQLVGFGSFEPRKRAARTGRNPMTGKSLKIEASVVPAFHAGKAFKEAVNPKPVKKSKKK